jgi:exosome complex RNA-binding protein Rrp42 (RNase PH superfamily)
MWILTAFFVALIFLSPASGAMSMSVIAFVCALVAVGLMKMVRQRRPEA